jgi:DNA polymerase-4
MIIYVQVPDLYAAVEQSEDPDLRGRPVVVGGDPHKRGTVTSANALAREAGVREGMPVREALECCPDAVLRATRLRRYREVAGQIRAILRGATDRLEPVGLDGTYLQVPPRVEPLPLAAQLCVGIQAELGVSARAGIGVTRFVAHRAAEHAGPGDLRLVRAEESLSFLAPLPVTEIWGLGPATGSKLEAHGLRRIGDLQGLDRAALEPIVGRNAQRFLALANAQDRDPLRPQPQPKSCSQEETLDEPTRDLRVIGERIAELAARLAATLERERRVARTVSLGLRYLDAAHVTRTQTLAEPLESAAELRDAALELLARTQAGIRTVRRVRIQVSNLARKRSSEDARQLRLF